MTYQPFLIAPLGGLDDQVDPWLLPDQAFSSLKNVYIDRGVIKKRRGSSVFGQLGRFVDDEAYATGNGGKGPYTHTASNTPVIAGSVIITEAGGQDIVDDGDGTLSGDGTGTVNYTTGAISATFTANVGVVAITCDYHYSDAGTDRVVRGVYHFDRADGSTELLAFDKRRGSKWDATYKYFKNLDNGSGTYDIWNNDNLIWAYAYNDKLWICDNASVIYTYDGTDFGLETANLQYGSGGTDTIRSALMIFPYYERLVMLNTLEGSASTRYPQRARWSQAGSVSVWRDDIAGQGGYNDAPTNEKIVSAAFLRGKLVVFFERSVWLLEYTANPDLPFRWNRINSTREIDATFGTLSFDQYVVGTGKYDLIACDGVNTQTFNKKLPDFSLEIDYDYIDLCFGNRSNSNEQAFLAYPSKGGSVTYPDTLLVYNYTEEAFSKYQFTDKTGGVMQLRCLEDYTKGADVTFTSMQNGTYWSEITSPATFTDFTNYIWDDLSFQKGELISICGSEDGYVYELPNPNSDDDNGYDYNFEILTKRYNPFQQLGKEVVLGHIDFLVDVFADVEVQVDFYLDNETSPTGTLTRFFDCSGDGARTWKTVYCGASGDTVRIRLKHSGSDETSMNKNFNVHAMRLNMKPGGRQ